MRCRPSFGTGQPATRDAPNKGYLPFSFGKRACIGATLVLVEGTVVLALMAQRFTFHEVSRRSVMPLVLIGVRSESPRSATLLGERV